MKKFLTPPVIIGLSVVVAAVILVYGFVIYKKPVLQNTAQAKTVDLTESVSVSGTVVAAKDVTLSFQRGGQVVSLVGDVGTRVNAGQVIATVSSGALVAQLNGAKAALASEQLKLNNLQSPNSTDASGVQISISNARATLLTQLGQSYVSLDSALSTNVDALFSSPRTNPNFGTTITQGSTSYSISAPYALASKINTDRITLNASMAAWNTLSAKASASQNDADISAEEVQAEKTLQDALTLLSDINSALGSYIATDATSQTIYTGYKQSISSAITTINTSLGTVRSAKQSYASAQAPISNYDVSLERTGVAAAEAQVQAIQAQIALGAIVSPISGVITEESIKLGENALQGTPVIHVMSNGKFQVEAYVSEADINKLKIGGMANITLISNSMASSSTLAASIIAVDPAETMTNGIGSYKVTLQFATEDASIKSGMTANVNFIVTSQTHVLAIPESALITKNNQSYVLVPAANGQTVTKQISVGIKGEGFVQITAGLNEGDSVIEFGSN